MNPSVRSLAVLSTFVTLSACGGGGGGGGSPAAPSRWLVMIYMAADNNVDGGVPLTLNTMETAAASPWVTTVVQVDTRHVPVKGSTTCKRLLIQPDSDPSTITSPTVADLGEINSGTSAAIQNFVVWAKSTYPADRYVLVLWDHGGQWTGWGSDESSGTSSISFGQLRTMFTNIQAAAGIAKWDLVGFDACLMAGLEIDQMLAPFAAYRVASCQLEFGAPGLSQPWDYGAILRGLVAAPSMSVPDMGRLICDSFMAKQQGRGYENQTLSLVDLSQIPALVAAVHLLAQRLLAILPNEILPSIARARRDSAGYGLMEGNCPPVFIDLRDFAEKITGQVASSSAVAAAVAVRQAVDLATIHRVQGTLEARHGGISVYFPNQASCDPDQPGYASVDLAATTSWDEMVTAYQSLLKAGGAAPGVVITSPSGSAAVSTSSPLNVTYSLSGMDLFQTKAIIYHRTSSTTRRMLGEIDFASQGAGSHSFLWDGRPFVLWDGATTYAEYLCPISMGPGTGLYGCLVRIGSGTTVVDAVAVVELNWGTGSGKISGVYVTVGGGPVIPVPLAPGNTIRMLIPTFDIANPAAITLAPSATVFTVPSGGLEAMRIYRVSMGSGSSHDLSIYSTDYAEYGGSDLVTLWIP